MPAPPRIWIVTHRQFADHQGHNLLARYLGARSVRLAGWTGSLAQRLLARLLRRRPGGRRLNPALAYHLHLANQLSRRAQVRGEFIHLIWGDDLIEHLTHPGRCIVTLHQPYELWTEATWRQLARCAGVVCMAGRECEQVRQRLPWVPAVFIPHGIDIDFWRPAATPPLRQICIVGRYLRNFPMLLRVSQQLLQRYPDLTIRWLVNPDFQLSPELAHGLPPERFELVRDLSAAQLHQFYAESWLCFIPYDNVTASNAIVEAMASGIPVFTTQVGGMASYAGDGALTMVANNADEAMLDALTRCLDSAEVRARQSARVRSHAESHFSWPRIVSAHEDYYARLAGYQEAAP